MDTKKMVDEKINLLLDLEALYKHSDKPNYARIINDCIKAIKRGEEYQQEDLKAIQFYMKYYNMWKVLKANTDKKTIDYMNKLEQKYFPKEQTIVPQDKLCGENNEKINNPN